MKGETAKQLQPWRKTAITESLRKMVILIVPALFVSCSYRHAATLMKGEDQMSTTHQALHVSISINRPPNEVYAFVSNPANLPRWATGLGGSIRNENGEWIADAPMGKVKIKFTERNKFGILDHEVILESGVRVYNPVRVIANSKGSEIIFTLIRQPGIPDEKFAEDAGWVKKDLKILKGLLEGS